MEVEIDFLSTEVVIPSSPTPYHLNHYNLSLLDQIMPPYFIPIYLFYQAKDNIITNSQKLVHLKKSLSHVLTLFYPLAGRLVGNNYVNCNDEGVTFIEALAKCKLHDFITDPILEELDKFVHCDLDGGKDDNPCLVVQATFFRCGGLVIGFKIPHKLADAVSIFTFVNSWAAVSRGDDVVQSPKFESYLLFPPIGFGCLSPAAIEKKENIVTKRFVFSAQKIADLREKYYTKKNTNDEGLIRFSRTEILSAFIWTRFLFSTGAKEDASKVYGIQSFVDIRTKVVPPLSEYHFGNICFVALAVPSLENDEDCTHEVVNKIRDAIRDVDGDYVAIKERVENIPANLKGIVMLRFSSICKVPLYKADFGWGIPVWFASSKIPLSNMVFFANTLSGGGIEALVNLKEEDMAKFEVDEELLEYVSSRDDTKFWSRI